MTRSFDRNEAEAIAFITREHDAKARCSAQRQKRNLRLAKKRAAKRNLRHRRSK